MWHTHTWTHAHIHKHGHTPPHYTPPTPHPPQGFEKTGLGERVAQLFVRAFGKSTLGLAYGLNVAEALIAPAMPSTTARAGGIFMPIMRSLSLAAGSKPNDPSSKRLGSYLVQVCVCVGGVLKTSV